MKLCLSFIVLLVVYIANMSCYYLGEKNTKNYRISRQSSSKNQLPLTKELDVSENEKVDADDEDLWYPTIDKGNGEGKDNYYQSKELSNNSKKNNNNNNSSHSNSTIISKSNDKNNKSSNIRHNHEHEASKIVLNKSKSNSETIPIELGHIQTKRITNSTTGEGGGTEEETDVEIDADIDLEQLKDVIEELEKEAKNGKELEKRLFDYINEMRESNKKLEIDSNRLKDMNTLYVKAASKKKLVQQTKTTPSTTITTSTSTTTTVKTPNLHFFVVINDDSVGKSKHENEDLSESESESESESNIGESVGRKFDGESNSLEEASETGSEDENYQDELQQVSFHQDFSGDREISLAEETKYVHKKIGEPGEKRSKSNAQGHGSIVSNSNSQNNLQEKVYKKSPNTFIVKSEGENHDALEEIKISHSHNGDSDASSGKNNNNLLSNSNSIENSSDSQDFLESTKAEDHNENSNSDGEEEGGGGDEIQTAELNFHGKFSGNQPKAQSRKYHERIEEFDEYKSEQVANPNSNEENEAGYISQNTQFHYPSSNKINSIQNNNRGGFAIHRVNLENELKQKMDRKDRRRRREKASRKRRQMKGDDERRLLQAKRAMSKLGKIIGNLKSAEENGDIRTNLDFGQVDKELHELNNDLHQNKKNNPSNSGHTHQDQDKKTEKNLPLNPKMLDDLIRREKQIKEEEEDRNSVSQLKHHHVKEHKRKRSIIK